MKQIPIVSQIHVSMWRHTGLYYIYNTGTTFTQHDAGNFISRSYINRLENGEFKNLSLLSDADLSPVKQIKINVLRFIKTRICFPSFIQNTSDVAFYQLGLKNHAIQNPETPYGPLLAHGVSQSNLKRSVINDAYSIIEENLLSFSKFLNSKNVTLTIIYVPAQFDVSDSFFNNIKRHISFSTCYQCRIDCDSVNITLTPWTHCLAVICNFNLD